MLINNYISKFINVSVKNNQKHMFKQLIKDCSSSSSKRGILELCLKNGYSSHQKIKRLKGGNPTTHIRQLIDYGILEKSELKEEEKKDLLRQQGMNNYNIEKMIIYRLTEKSAKILQNTGLKSYIIENIKKCYSKVYTMTKDKFNTIFNLRKQLQAIDMNTFSRKCRVLADWSYFEISNLWEFMRVKIRKVCEYTGLSKEGLERIERNVCELVGLNINQLRTLITSRKETEKWMR